MARKKKRSAKQLANDRRLGRMAKARAKKKRPSKRRKKVAKRKNPHKKTAQRKSVAKPHLWLVFKCDGSKVMFLAIGKQPWRTAKGDGIFFRTKSAAESAARIMAGKRGMAKYHIGAASADTTAAQIAAHCQGGKG